MVQSHDYISLQYIGSSIPTVHASKISPSNGCYLFYNAFNWVMALITQKLFSRPIFTLMMNTPITLNQENLIRIPATTKTPSYPRDQVKTSIVHIGVGNFHRSHQAYYTDQLMEQTGVLDCGICGIGLLDSDRHMREALKAQDGLYTLVVKELDGSLSPRVIGSIADYIFAPENPTAAIERMAAPETQIISLTITEGGYNLTETGDFNFSNPVVLEDLNHPMSPKTVFGYLAQSLKLRMRRGIRGITIQSCDNVQENGGTAKKSLLAYVERAEPELISWIEDNASFPNSMVDRITPVTSADDIEILRDQFHITDQWPVFCEPFIQWVIEDDFIAGRPEWEKVGAQFVEDVVPYENMKLRLLNAGHSVLGILGALHGYKTIDQAARDEDFVIFLRGFMDQEASPTLLKLGGIDLEKYKDNLIQRFQNIHIRDSISRICQESSAKLPIFLLPTVKVQLRGSGKIDRAAFVIAAWCKYNDGIDENGSTYLIEDALKDELTQAAARSYQDPIRFLEIKQVFGDLAENQTFANAFVSSLEMLRSKKVKACVREMNLSLP
jgi:mannitol 2-dehydrogenase